MFKTLWHHISDEEQQYSLEILKQCFVTILHNISFLTEKSEKCVIMIC